MSATVETYGHRFSSGQERGEAGPAGTQGDTQTEASRALAQAVPFSEGRKGHGLVGTRDNGKKGGG
jgi:hypothetical protein